MQQSLRVLLWESLLLAYVWIAGGFILATFGALLEGSAFAASLTTLFRVPLTALTPAALYGLGYGSWAERMGVQCSQPRVFLIDFVLFIGSALMFACVADLSWTKFLLLGSRKLGFAFLLVIMFLAMAGVRSVVDRVGLWRKRAR